MQIKSAEFKASYTSVQQCLDSSLPEIAFIGRSNVGKSSLINYLVTRKDLVKVSGTPGKTQLLNYFIINQSFYFVDLPGYGYAKVPKGIRQQFGKMIEDYIRQRRQLRCVCLLIDSRIDPQESDVTFVKNLIEWGVHFILIYTKTEKTGPMRLANHRKEFAQRTALPPDTPIFITSSTHRIGQKELLDYFATLITS